MSQVVVIGIGAMGGGMARALLDSPATSVVVGYDKATDAVQRFHAEAQAAGKALGDSAPLSLRESIQEGTDFAVMSLVNEAQCEEVCFGGDENLLNLMPKGSCVIITSTVTATWAMKADEKFRSSGILFVDCPVSGGPARARDGDLTLIASGETECLDFSGEILDAMAREVHVIKGGAGGGSTVKCIHQLLAGVHICAAAEAMAMAAKAGVDVSQLYKIVNGAAGASWMFTDRGARMLEEDPEVKSALAIFVKDMDIVYAEAKKLMSPIPVASAALQQFISGQSLGLGKHDDSQVVKVYENVTGTPVSASAHFDGIEKYSSVFQNEFVQVEKSIGVSGVTFSLDSDDQSTHLKFSKFNVKVRICKSPTVSTSQAMTVDKHSLAGETSKARVYRLSLGPGESVYLSYPFCHLKITATGGKVKQAVLLGSKETGVEWSEDISPMSIEWGHPVLNHRLTNAGTDVLDQYIVELL